MSETANPQPPFWTDREVFWFVYATALVAYFLGLAQGVWN